MDNHRGGLFPRRRHSWIAPLWVAMVPLVIILFGAFLESVFEKPLLGRYSDGGITVAYFIFAPIFGAALSVPGLLLLLSFPRDQDWGRHAVIPCLLAVAVSTPLFAYAIYNARCADEWPVTAEIIVPDGFTGLFFIKRDNVHGQVPQRVDGLTRYVVPASGLLLSRDVDALRTRQMRVRYENQPEFAELYRKRGGPIRFGELGSCQSTLIFWVGTHAQYEEFRKHNDPIEMAEKLPGNHPHRRYPFMKKATPEPAEQDGIPSSAPAAESSDEGAGSVESHGSN